MCDSRRPALGSDGTERHMEVLLKCAACGAEVAFEDDSPSAEATCPDCEVHLRRRPGDEQMAIPVGMVLPDKFSQVDLKSLTKQSEVLIERYRKTPLPGSAPADAGSTVDATLAKALESLAHTIGHLDERLARQEQRGDGGHSVEEVAPEADEVRRPMAVRRNTVDPPQEEIEEVVQLEAEPEKALPLQTRVLVRREAAQEAHGFQRKKQSLVDHRGREQVHEGFFESIMERAPKTTITLSLLFVIGITVGAIVWMDPTYEGKDPRARVLEPTKNSELGKLWADDPEAGQAEMVARGYLNATTARAARPYVYESDTLGEKFTRLYEPIDTPGDYEIELKSRVQSPDGKGSIFAYRVKMANERSQMMVILPEGKMPKVYWQFFAEIGDMSWKEYMEEQPIELTRMLVWAEESKIYTEGYDPEQWASYMLHDYDDRYTLQAFVERGAGPEWKIKKALETEPRKFGRRDAIMAQVHLSFIRELPNSEEERVFVVEVKEVEATDWLPARFRAGQGPTIEASEVE